MPADMAISHRPIKPIHIVAYVFGGDTIFSLHPQFQLAVECIDMVDMVNTLFVLSSIYLHKVSRNTLCKRLIGIMAIGANG